MQIPPLICINLSYISCGLARCLVNRPGFDHKATPDQCPSFWLPCPIWVNQQTASIERKVSHLVCHEVGNETLLKACKNACSGTVTYHHNADILGAIPIVDDLLTYPWPDSRHQDRFGIHHLGAAEHLQVRVDEFTNAAPGSVMAFLVGCGSFNQTVQWEAASRFFVCLRKKSFTNQSSSCRTSFARVFSPSFSALSFVFTRTAEQHTNTLQQIKSFVGILREKEKTEDTKPKNKVQNPVTQKLSLVSTYILLPRQEGSFSRLVQCISWAILVSCYVVFHSLPLSLKHDFFRYPLRTKPWNSFSFLSLL